MKDCYNFFITHPLAPSLKLEKGKCGARRASELSQQVVIPLYNVREGERGGELPVNT